MGLGWRAIFLVNLPVALLVVLFGIPLLKETRAQDPRKLDLVGMALSMVTLGALIVPLIEGREAGWPLWSWLSLIACWDRCRRHSAGGSSAHPPRSPPSCSFGFGQGVGLPTLMRMVTGRVAPALSGMIAGIASSTLQLSTALSVALIGGIFYTVLEARSDPAAITKAFIVAILCIAGFLAAGVGLSITLARRRPRIAGG